MVADLTFILVPDSSAGRRLRRFLASKKTRLGLKVGTWIELLTELQTSYLVPESTGWSESLHKVLASRSDAFWAPSYKVDTNGVAASVEAAWREILSSQPPLTAWPVLQEPQRISRRLADLDALNGIDIKHWPADLAIAISVMKPDAKPVRPVSLYALDWDDQLNPWQLAVINHVAAQASPIAPELEANLAEFCQDIATPRAGDNSRLAIVQRALRDGDESWGDADGSCEFIACRDSLEGVETAAGLIQQRIENDPSLIPEDFGLLIPQDFDQAGRVKTIFERCGLPVSNLGLDVQERDLAHELLRFALMRFEGPAPSMAIQALVSNPLMPWPLDTGRRLAETLNDYDFSLKTHLVENAAQRKFLQIFEQPVSIEHLDAAIDRLIENLNPDATLAEHRERTPQTAIVIQQALRNGERDWQRLRELAPTQNVRFNAGSEVIQEGVCVVSEGRLPLHPLRELLVLDFSEGHFPASTTMPAAFSPDEWRSIRTQLQAQGNRIDLPHQKSMQARAALRRQLRHVSERVTFLIPRYSMTGATIAPSSSLMDFALLNKTTDEPERLILELEREHDRCQISGLPLIDPASDQYTCIEPRRIEAQDITLNANLLADHEISNEKPRTLSPSTLDTLLVSPLAWLLKKLGAEPKNWEPDAYTPLTNGSIAHEVFEVLFPEGSFEPQKDQLTEGLSEAFERGIGKVAPFLAGPEWAVERNHLKGIVERAAMAWADTMIGLGARLVQPEISLIGQFDGLAIAGQADAVLDVPDVGAVVLDYKNASSKRYLDRMEAGLDLQTALYREMLRTGGAKDQESDAAKRLAELNPTGVMYYTMQDKQAVADFPAPAALGNWRFDGREVSGNGLAQLQARFKELRQGLVRSPRDSEIKAFKKAGIGMYALESSALTAAVLDDQGGEA